MELGKFMLVDYDIVHLILFQIRSIYHTIKQNAVKSAFVNCKY